MSLCSDATSDIAIPPRTEDACDAQVEFSYDYGATTAVARFVDLESQNMFGHRASMC